MVKKRKPTGRLSKSQYEDSWREDFMDYDSKQNISQNTLAVGYIGE